MGFPGSGAGAPRPAAGAAVKSVNERAGVRGAGRGKVPEGDFEPMAYNQKV